MALVGSNLDDKLLSFLDIRARAYCGVLVSSPQFMLGGFVPADTDAMPKLSLPETSYDAMCMGITLAAGQIAAPYTITCEPGKVMVTK